MPDPNTEHGLRVQLATALRERDEQKARADAAEADLRFARLAEKERAKVQESFQEALAAALRAAESSAPERIFTKINSLIAEFGHDPVSALSIVSGYVDEALHGILRARALIPPAAAPAAETGHGKLRHWNADGVLCPECFPEEPAAETGKAQGPEVGYDADNDRYVRESVYLAAWNELAAVLRGKDEMGEKLAKALGVPAGPLGRLVDEAIARIALIRECEAFVRWMIRAEGSKWDEARSDALLAKLAARAAPPEREGK